MKLPKNEDLGYANVGFIMWGFPLNVVITIDKQRNCFGSIAEL